jgi:hypothetical protein
MTRMIWIAALIWSAQTTISLAATPSGLWQDKCSRCHGAIKPFTAQSLKIDQSTPVLRSNDQPLTTFLRSHGRLSADEIAILNRWMLDFLSGSKR